MGLINWFRSFIVNGPADHQRDSFPISKVGDDQTEFATYGEAMSWVMQTGKFAVFNWDERKQCYVRMPE